MQSFRPISSPADRLTAGVTSRILQSKSPFTPVSMPPSAAPISPVARSLVGMVRQVGKYTKGQERTYQVQDSETSNLVCLVIPAVMFCPLAVDDTLSVEVYGTPDKFVATSQPEVSISVDPNGICNLVYTVFKYKKFTPPAYGWYTAAVEHCKQPSVDSSASKPPRFSERTKSHSIVVGNDGVAGWLTELAWRLVTLFDSSAIKELAEACSLQSWEAGLILREWYPRHTVRRLQLLGLSKRQIWELRFLNPCRLYTKAVSNPSQIVELEWEVCVKLAVRSCTSLTADDQARHTLARDLRSSLTNSSWVCAPFLLMEKRYTNLMSIAYQLENYDLHFDYNYQMIYPLPQYQVEIFTAWWLNQLIDRTLDAYAVNRPSLDLVHSAQINYSCSTLTLEQKLAILGSQIGWLSIVTGMGGSGKCLGRGTKVRLYNQQIIAVEDIRVHDLLMGPDGAPREVMSTCIGRDSLVRVAARTKPELYFVCNLDHILTLRCSLTHRLLDISVREFMECSSLEQSNYRLITVNDRWKVDAAYDFDIKPAGFDDYFGFTLALPTNLRSRANSLQPAGRFMLANGLVTHNTTVIREIKQCCEARGQQVAIASFTGKAVSRLHEVMDSEVAMTLDRMIWESDKIPLFDTIVIDESSMMSTELFYRFKQAFSHDFRIILVGDCNQLPPIQPGCLMRQLIQTQRVPIFTLTSNQRLMGSTVDGLTPSSVEMDRSSIHNTIELVNNQRNLQEPMHFIESEHFQRVEGDLTTLETMLRRMFADGIARSDFLVVTPYLEEAIAINRLIQNIYSATAKGCTDEAGRRWFVGDRVMARHNNYRIKMPDTDVLGYVNTGLEGYITEVIPDRLEVTFPKFVHQVYLANPPLATDEDRVLDTVNRDQLHTVDLMLSSAVTVHKAQGDEYPFVIAFLPPPRPKSRFVNLNLLYVQITRGQKCTVVMEMDRALVTAAGTALPRRYECLARRLMEFSDAKREQVLHGFTIIRPPVFTACGPDTILDPDEWTSSEVPDIEDF